MSAAPVVIYTDGACEPNPGIGGWGVVFQLNGKQRTFSGGEKRTTNNRMEMMAAIVALEMLKQPVSVLIHSDSRYVIDGFTKWLAGWERKGILHTKANADLWVRLRNAAARHSVRWEWVKGHSGNPGNELADHLSVQGRLKILADEQQALAAFKALEFK